MVSGALTAVCSEWCSDCSSPGPNKVCLTSLGLYLNHSLTDSLIQHTHGRRLTDSCAHTFAHAVTIIRSLARSLTRPLTHPASRSYGLVHLQPRTDENGNFHALAHNGDGPFPCGDGPALNGRHYGTRYRDGNPYPIGCSAHLYSENGLDWHMSPVAASNASILLTSGVSVDLFRQRPKVLTTPLGKGSAITHLFHGSMLCGERQITGGDGPNNQCANTSWPGGGPPYIGTGDGAGSDNVGITAPTDMDYSFTTVVPLNTATP
jgi:hypothetical protein